MHNVKRRELTEKERQVIQNKIEEYNTINNLLLAKRVSFLADKKIRPDELKILLKATQKMLSINPAYVTIWNFRRDLVDYLFSTSPDSKIFEKELKMTSISLEAEPKAYIIWLYRQWIVEHEYTLPGQNKQELINRELEFVANRIEEDNRNFHAWNYRRWVCKKCFGAPVLTSTRISELNSGSTKKNDSDSLDEYDEEEWIDDIEFTKECIENDFSNYSAWHQRYLALKKAGLNEESHKELHDAEIEFVSSCLDISPGDESLWLYFSLVCGPGDTEAMKQVLEDCGRSRNGVIRFIAHVIDYNITVEKEYSVELLDWASWNFDSEVTLFSWLRKEVEAMPLISQLK